MTKGVVTASPDQPVTQALAEMRRRAFHHLVVVEKGRVIGIMSARDRGETGAKVRDVMHGEVVSAKPETTVRQAANLLRGRSIGCLPVFDDDKLVGIVTTTDLLELLGRGVEKPVAETKRWNQGRRPSRAQKRT